MSIINKIMGGGGGSGLSEAQVDARVVAVAGESLNQITRKVSINDDAAWSYDFGEAVTTATVIVTANSTTTIPNGVFAVRAASSPSCSAIVSNNMSVTTGALAGTTGSDNTLTISAHSDNNIYIENRRGGTVALTVTIFAEEIGP